MGVIFVAGVHGVGKTTACAAVAKLIGFPHYSASDLIRAEKQNPASRVDKAVLDVEGNQASLIQGVQRVRESHRSPIILDGHFTLLRPGGEFDAIPVGVFRALHLVGIVVYHDVPEAISERMGRRDKNIFDPVPIDKHQRFELEHAHFVAYELGIPIKVLKAFDENGLMEQVSIWNFSGR